MTWFRHRARATRSHPKGRQVSGSVTRGFTTSQSLSPPTRRASEGEEMPSFFVLKRQDFLQLVTLSSDVIFVSQAQTILPADRFVFSPNEEQRHTGVSAYHHLTPLQ